MRSAVRSQKQSLFVAPRRDNASPSRGVISPVRPKQCTSETLVCKAWGAPAAVASTNPTISKTAVHAAIVVLCACGSVLCIALVFLVKKLMNTAKMVEKTLELVNEEIPSLSASARLTGLELADCIVEFSQLGKEVTGGIKAGAKAIQSTEATLQEGGKAVKHAWSNHVVPGFKERVRASKDIMDHSLQANAGLTYSDNAPAHMAASTKVAIQELRGTIAAMGALYQVATRGLSLLLYVLQANSENISEGHITKATGEESDKSVSNHEAVQHYPPAHLPSTDSAEGDKGSP